jgi:hypothetical protein
MTETGNSLPKFALKFDASVSFKITIANGQICDNS